MKITTLYIFFAFLLLAISCKERPDPIEVVTDPVFSVRSSIAGESKSFEAGVDGYYLFTDYEYDSLGVYSLIGEFRPVGCEVCKEVLRIEFRDVKLRGIGASIPIDSVLQVGNYLYHEPKVTLLTYQTRFTALPNGEGPFTYFWDLGDGNSRSQKAFFHTYTNLAPTNYTVSLSVQNAQGCTSELSMPITIPKPSCFPTFTHSPSPQTRELQFDALPAGNGPFTYLWDFGDGRTATTKSTDHIFEARGVYPACLTVNDGAGCEATLCRNVEVGYANGCPVNLAYQTTPIYQGDSLGFGKVVVTWIDAGGTRYSSEDGTQPGTSFFELISHEAYEPNSEGTATERVNVRLQCTLFDEAGAEKELVITEGTMAIGYP